MIARFMSFYNPGVTEVAGAGVAAGSERAGERCFLPGDGGVVSLTPRRKTEAGLAADVGAVVAGVLGLVVGAKKPTSRSPIL